MTPASFARGAAEAAAIVRDWAEARGPGGAVVLFDESGVREAASGGFASLEHAIPFTPSTPHRWASISKQVCGATLLLSGFDRDQPLGTLVPGLAPALAEVPLGRALDMTGAIPDLMELLWLLGEPFTASYSEADLLALCRRLPGTGGPPGREMAYSNTGWRLTQAAFPAARGESYEAALRRLLLAPLGLDGIAFPADEATPVPGLATGYWHDGQGWRRGRYGLHFSPSGGLAGSALALAGWGSALMAGRGPLSGVRAALTAPGGAGGFYRTGLATTALGELPLIGHGGSLPGVKNHLLMAPALGCGVAVVANREDADALWLALRVMSALSGEPLPEPASLPAGLYASAEGPEWAEVEGAGLTFMGVQDRLFAGPAGPRTLPAYLEAKLNPGEGGALEGCIGGVARRLLPVPVFTLLDAALVGRWRNAAFGAELEVREDGTALLPGTHPRESCTLRPLPGGRAIADRRHGPWRLRPLLWLQPDGTLRLVAHRARVLDFHRMA